MKIPKPWLRKANQTYYVEIGGRQIPLGKDKRKANQKCRELLKDTDFIVAKTGTTIHELVDEYMDWVKHNRAETTATNMEYMMDSFKNFVPDIKAELITPAQIDNWIKSTDAKSPSTVAKRITTFRGLFKWGKGWGLVKSNPLADMPSPTPVGRDDWLPFSRWGELLDKCNTPELRDFLCVMLYSGARTEEMFRLEAKHFDGKRFVLPPAQAKGRKRTRVIYLLGPALEIVQRLVEANPEGKLFLNSHGRPWDHSSINCAMRKLKVAMNFPELRATTMRHSFCTALLLAGKDVHTVQKLMGHASLQMIATKYSHIQDSTFLQEQTDEITKMLSGLGIGPDQNGESLPPFPHDNAGPSNGKA